MDHICIMHDATMGCLMILVVDDNFAARRPFSSLEDHCCTGNMEYAYNTHSNCIPGSTTKSKCIQFLTIMPQNCKTNRNTMLSNIEL